MSMDGPSVNWSFLKKLMATLPDDAVKFLETWSMEHAAFQTGCQSTGWNLDQLLSGLYNCFKDSPLYPEGLI